MNEKLNQIGKNNKDSLRVPINNFWDVEVYLNMLENYPDKEIVDFVRYGWPISHNRKTGNPGKTKNWGGALNHMKKVREYLAVEIERNSVMGPSTENPFGTRACFSPISSRAKSNSTERRVIVDLSHPEGNSINDGIEKDHYLGKEIDLKFPTIDALVRIVKQKGRGCLMFKRDLKRAYRQIQVDPRDIHLLGYVVDSEFYFDVTLPMGLRSAAYVCQRITDSLMFIFKEQGYIGVNYIDDLASAETIEKAEIAYQALGEILQKIGILESKEKATPPKTRMVFLGIQVDSVEFTLSLCDEKMKDLEQVLLSWKEKESATLKEIQSLVGVLSFASGVIPEGRLFFSRILEFMKSSYKKAGRNKIPESLQKDVKWWLAVAPTLNGEKEFESDTWLHPDCLLHTDACLTGVGGYMNGLYFHHEIPNNIQEVAVGSNHCEIYGILVAVKAWSKWFQNKNILIYCDNKSSVDILSTGRSACVFSQSVLREIRFWSCEANCKIRGVHLPGEKNEIADALSRWHTGEKYEKKFRELTKGTTVQRTVVENLQINEFW